MYYSSLVCIIVFTISIKSLFISSEFTWPSYFLMDFSFHQTLIPFHILSIWKASLINMYMIGIFNFVMRNHLVSICCNVNMYKNTITWKSRGNNRVPSRLLVTRIHGLSPLLITLKWKPDREKEKVIGTESRQTSSLKQRYRLVQLDVYVPFFLSLLIPSRSLTSTRGN